MVLTLLLAAAVVLNQTPDLEHLRWSNRVLLLFADHPHNPQLQEQTDLLEQAAKELAKRDVKVYQVVGSLPQNITLRLKFHVTDSPFTAVLIGKDGTRKLLKHKPVRTSELFGLIDSMPMRKNEMSWQPPQ